MKQLWPIDNEKKCMFCSLTSLIFFSFYQNLANIAFYIIFFTYIYNTPIKPGENIILTYIKKISFFFFSM